MQDAVSSAQITRVAEKMLASVRHGMGRIHELAESGPEVLPRWAAPAYMSATEFLAARGYRMLGDMRVPSLFEHSVVMPTIVRVHVAEDGTQASFYQRRLWRDPVWRLFLRGLLELKWGRAWAQLRQRPGTHDVVALVTAFEDGYFVDTSNTQAAQVWTSPPRIDAQRLDYGTPPQDVLALHDEHVARHAREAESAVRRIRTLGDVRDLQSDMQAVCRAHREAVGWITREEVHRMTGGARYADRLHAGIQRLVAQERQVDPD